MEQQPWQQALLQAAHWLQQVSQHRSEIGKNKASFAALAQSLSAVGEMHLAIHAPPASLEAELDVLIHLPKGTLALGWQANEGLAWSVQQADHWAANLVLSVDDTHTTLQSALLFLNSQARSQPDLMENLVQRAILANAMQQGAQQQTLPEIDELAIENELLAFRQRQHLCSAQAMQTWLQETQLTLDALRELIANNLRALAFRQSLVEPDIETYFAQHQHNYTRYTMLQVSGLHAAQAELCAQTWQTSGTCPLLDEAASSELFQALPTLKMDQRFFCELPTALKELVGDAQTRAILGPFSFAGKYAVAQLIRITPAVLDTATRQAISQVLFARWMDEQRARAKVVWHWM